MAKIWQIKRKHYDHYMNIFWDSVHIIDGISTVHKYMCVKSEVSTADILQDILA